ncbi:SDR family oxidoreductase [Candidatus Obscuribacterales bacterium]|nr:SDR family oxidoreductase [Candidatus Obscuribacterales bacterium]
MQLNLNGKNAIVTGASYGLGFACAQALAEEGANVSICSRAEDKVVDAVQKIEEAVKAKYQSYAYTPGDKREPPRFFGLGADLTTESDLNRVVDESQKTFGDIDVLVLSTGHPPTYPFSVATDEQWQRGIDLLLRPAIVLPRLLIPAMKKNNYGRIIFLGSIFGLEAEKSSVIQSTLRTGLNALAKCIATEYAADGITANVICPGYFDTPLVQGLAQQYADSQKVSRETVLQDWADYSPMKKFGKPEDLGALVAFLASPRAEFITGTTITIDGGAVRQW